MYFGQKIVGGCTVAVLFICLIAAPHARAMQGQPPAPPADQTQSDSRRQSEGIGRQLARETREAAGEEEDQTAQFKQSTPVRWIAEHIGLSLRHAYWLCVVFNFAVIGVVLVQVGRKHLPGLFRDRSAAIQHAMQEAQKASEEARRRLADIESRLMKLDVEIGMMRDAAEKEAAEEEVRIKSATEEEARKIVESAELEIAAAGKAARRDLSAYAADLAVGLAKRQIHVDPGTDESLVHGFAAQLTASANGPREENR